jgi:hypothetical protein
MDGPSKLSSRVSQLRAHYRPFLRNTPLAVNLRTDRHAVTGGEATDVEVWLLNDLPHPQKDLRVVYSVEMDGRVLLRNRCLVGLDAATASCQGRLQWKTPDVHAESPLKICASLLDSSGTVLHDYDLSLQVFPQFDNQLLRKSRVAVIGNPGGRAWSLAESFGASPENWNSDSSPDILIVDDAGRLAAENKPVTDYLSAGGVMLGLSQPHGAIWRMADRPVKIIPLVGHQFVSRKTGHPVVSGFAPDHFSLWFDHQRGRIAHLLDSGLEGEGLTPITLTAHGIWYTERREIPAGAELKVGYGLVIFDQVFAAERQKGEPRASAYLEAIFRYSLNMQIEVK